ncbi:terminase large subunit [Bacillus phage SP8]|uniref:Terminase large subunit n=1 Tax=Bacillus phage Adastra TaxID=3143958 RepID=A0AAU8BB74_9CAUD|nr:terminase large subunit [Bacillus phage SP8]
MAKYTKEQIQRALINRLPTLYALRHRYIKGNPLTFKSTKNPIKHRPWQIDILNDQHPDKVVRKSRQLGLSEMAVTEFIWFLDTHTNVNGMYTFPRKEQMEDFSNTRIAPIFDESPYLSSRLDRKMNNVRLKKLVNGSAMFLRSAWGSALGEGQAIDILGLDEYDRMKDGIELAFRESMKSSAYGLMRRWSTPTIPGRGVDLLFGKSDQRYYHHKCDKCGHWQIITLEDNIVCVNEKGVNLVEETIEDGTYQFQCQKCKQELNRWNKGEYVAQHPSRKDVRGYHISQLDAVWISADEIMRNQFDYKVKQLFYNYVVGMPYASEGLIITDQDVLNCVAFPDPIGYRDNAKYVKIVAGIDWGYFNWMVILGLTEDNQVHLLDFHWVEDNPNRPLDCVNVFTALLKPYDPDVIVADNGFGADRNSYLIQQFPGRTYACDWDTPKGRNMMVDQWNDNSAKVRVDKTVKMKRTLYNIKARALKTFGQGEKLAMLTKHLKNVRTLMEEEDGEIYERVARIGDDHGACALTYGYIALDRIIEAHKPKQDMNYDFI